MALINKQQLNALVLIENKNGRKIEPIATGFLIGFLVSKNANPEKKSYRIFLLTNRHVFLNKEKVWLRFNRKNNTGTARFELPLLENNITKWLTHKNLKVDLAMLTLSPDFLNQNNIEWAFFNEETIAHTRNFKSIGIELGDELFVFGFPMGLSGTLQNYPVIRSGLLSRVDKEIIKEQKAFLIDSSVFPGNSGGPVLLKPEIASIQGTSAVSSIYLLGVVSGYKPYREFLYSLQSNPPSVAAIAIENSGLASVVPMEFAKSIYNNWLRTKKKLEKVEKGIDKIIPTSKGTDEK